MTCARSASCNYDCAFTPDPFLYYFCICTIRTFVFSFIHSGTSYRGFGVKPDGKLYVELSIEPKRTYSFAVYLDFEGIDYKGNSVEGTAAANVHIYSLGMLQAAVIHTIHNLPLQLVPHLTMNFSLIVFSVFVHFLWKLR